MSLIVAIFNQSGGVGKSTLTRDLGYSLSQRGKKVLLVDADPQGTLGVFFGMSPATLPPEMLFWSDVCSRGLLDRRPRVVSPSRHSGLDLGLSNHHVLDLELALAQQHDPARLLSVFDRMRATYDFILVDCPPKISEITIQVLLASDGLLIPVQPEGKAVTAFAEVQREIALTQERRRNMRLPGIKVLGVVPTLVNPRLLLHRHHLEEIEAGLCAPFGYRMLDPIRHYVAVAEAGTEGIPLGLYDPHCPVNATITQIADQVMEVAA